MKLQEYIDSLDTSHKEALLGRETDDVRRGAFSSKRVVHAGLVGTPIAREERQSRWRDVLEQPADKERYHAVYIHIPFCQTKCLYCSFFQNASSQTAEDSYIDALLMEIERDTASTQLQTAEIDCVFIGGGTPTSLSARNAARLLSAVHEKFRLTKDAELTFEGRIHDLVPEKMEAWKAGGVNRISLGVQSFDTNLRRLVGRIDAREEVLRRLDALAAYDVTTIVDLIYGLPGQTEALWMSDLETLLTVPIAGMDLYQLNIFPSGSLAKAIEEGRVPTCADIGGQSDLYHMARNFLLGRGIERISLCHWRLDKRERSIYNTLAKTGAVVYPFGCGAGGNAGGLTFMQERQIAAYMDTVKRGEKPVMMMAQQVEKKLLRVADEIISGLERGYIDFRRITMMEEGALPLLEVLELWKSRGLLKEDLGLWRLTPAGEFWYISMSQSLVECAEAVMSGAGETAVEGEASSALDRVIAEMMPNATADERKQAAKKIPAAVRMMIRNSSYETLRSMLQGLPSSMREKMFAKAQS